MNTPKVLAIWFLWLLAVMHAGAAFKYHPKQQQKQKQHGSQQQQQQQQTFNAVLGLLAAQTAPAVATYQSVQQYNHSLPPPLLNNGLVYRGSSARLRRVVSKLLHGEKVHVAALGSSITYGRGVKRGTSDWFTLFSSWLQSAFPATKLTVRNRALPLARSEYISACLDQHVDRHADLVFVELTAADGYLDTSINNELVHAVERLIRKLLKLPNKPAVVVINALNPEAVPRRQQQQQQVASQGKQTAGASIQTQGTRQQQQQRSKQAQTTQPQQQQQQRFYYTIEDHIGVVAQYYELPWLSLRNAVWQGLVHGWEGFTTQQLFTEVKVPMQPLPTYHQQHQRQQQQSQGAATANPQQQQQQQQQQQIGPTRHLQQQVTYLPSALGHKYLADLAVSLLQQTFLQQLLRPLGPTDAAAADSIHAPMFPGNWEGHGSGCATGIDLRAAVRDEHKDWYFVTEGTPAHPRWGFVSHVPNATLVLQLDARSKGATGAAAQLTIAQKVKLLQRHGMFAAAADLLTADGGPPVQIVQIPVPTAEQAANMKIWAQGNGVESALAEAERQAAEAAIQLRLGQVKPYVNSERIMGANPYSALQLPPEARLEVGKTQTGTGVEVILPSKVGRRRLQQQQGADAADASGSTDSVGGSGSGSRLLQRTSNPLLVPPPYDAVYLKPNTDSSSSSTGGAAGKPSNSSSSSSSDGSLGTVGASIFSEYSLRPQPNMVVMVGYLKGPRHMGRARISCMSGCSCKSLTVDGWHAHAHMRLATAKLHVTQSPECLIGVEVLPESNSGHHKFKVTGVVVAQSVHYRSPESEWAHQYFLHPDLLPAED